MNNREVIEWLRKKAETVPMPGARKMYEAAAKAISCTHENDLISRQAAINALETTKRIASYELHGGEVLRTFNVVLNSLINIMSLLPPANNSEIPNSSDTISRQAAIDGKICIRRSNGVEIYDDYVVPVEYLEQLPPAQPEPKRGRWIYKTDLVTAPTGYWECSECKEGRLLYEENFCPHCGADMREVTT